MKKIVSSVCLLLFLFLISSSKTALARLNMSFNANQSQYSNWQFTENRLSNKPRLSTQNKRMSSSTADIVQLSHVLLQTEQAIVVSLPLPSGELADFKLSPSSIMPPELAERYPEIKTFSGYQLLAPENNGRFDITEHGFHGMFSYNNSTVFIEPQIQKNNTRYVSYYRNSIGGDISGKIKLQSPKKIPIIAQRDLLKNFSAKKQFAETSLILYRLAVSSSGEYSVFHGGSKSSVLSEIVTLVNRLNDVYQRDLSVKFELVANSDALIFLDPLTDPFNNNDQDGELNTTIIDGLIGSSNYDIGHVVNTEGGGLAGLGVVCDSIYKGDGVTGAQNPINDAFYIDYVAHEVGHQFGADHTFNGAEGACEGNRESNLAFEPGSASTIMGYAGICGSQNLQNNSDPYFHAKSIEQIKSYLMGNSGSTCGVPGNDINNIPLVDAGSDFTIPAHTPFTLSGSATDANNSDILTYSWQQIDLGTISHSITEQIDDGSRPLFRVWQPFLTAQRTLPRLEDILASTTSVGETYATTDRELNFRLLVRDARGGVGYDDNTIKVVNTNEAFAVTNPSSSIIWSSQQQVVNWNTANTKDSPISCSKVDILLSTDGGNNFTHQLAMQVDNNGSYEVTLSELTSTKSRIRINCSDNIFFAINEGDFTVDYQQTPIEPPVISGQETISIVEGTSLTLALSHFTFSGATVDKISLIEGNNYTLIDNTVTANSGFVGTLNVTVTAYSGDLMSEAFVAKISVTAKKLSTTSKSSSSGSFYWLLVLLVFIAVYRKSSLKLRINHV
ncbi:MAG: M12 family metallo-peptidase [Colwellia sp.]|nr:M12 family metallo-peptidase [Colwellia sp.]